MHLSSPPGPDQTTPLDLRRAARESVDVVMDRLGSGDAGLADVEAAARLDTFGPNVLQAQRVTVFGILLRQLRNPLLILLLAAAAISALTGDVTDGAIITVIVVLSVGLGFVNEYRSARAVAALHGDIHYDALVWRDGTQRKVDVTTLVPGDMVALRVGERRARGPESGRDHPARVRRGGAHRRVDAGGEVCRAVSGERLRGRPAFVRVHGNRCAPGVWKGGGGLERCGDRLRRDRDRTRRASGRDGISDGPEAT